MTEGAGLASTQDGRVENPMEDLAGGKKTDAAAFATAKIVEVQIYLCGGRK